MSAKILQGAAVVDAMNKGLFRDIQQLKDRGISPTLAILRVGEREDDISYETGATKRGEKIGVAIRHVVLPETVAQDELNHTIAELNEDPQVNGVLLFRPLPSHIDEDTTRNLLDPAKDIDGITDVSLAGVFSAANTGFAPCTARACIEILDHYQYVLEGKKAIVIGRSLVVGKPVAMMLLQRNATVTIAHSRTQDLPSLVKEADIVIACTGRTEMIDARCLLERQVVIDVGINFDAEGKMVGDVAFKEAESKVAAITPVPGGVGTVTTNTLILQVVEAAKRQHEEKATEG